MLGITAKVYSTLVIGFIKRCILLHDSNRSRKLKVSSCGSSTCHNAPRVLFVPGPGDSGPWGFLGGMPPRLIRAGDFPEINGCALTRLR